MATTVMTAVCARMLLDIARRQEDRGQKAEHDDQSDQDERRADAEQRQSDIEARIGYRSHAPRKPGRFHAYSSAFSSVGQIPSPPKPSRVSVPYSRLGLLSIDKRQRADAFASSCFLCIKIGGKRHSSGTVHETGYRLQEGAQRNPATARQRRVRCRTTVGESAAAARSVSAAPRCARCCASSPVRGIVVEARTAPTSPAVRSARTIFTANRKRPRATSMSNSSSWSGCCAAALSQAHSSTSWSLPGSSAWRPMASGNF